MKLLRPVLDAAGLRDVGITSGETTNWWRFLTWGYATAIWEDDAALQAMGLITSHGFTGGANQWFGTHEPGGNDLLRQKNPRLHSWTTSMSWGRMDAGFVEDIRGQIYEVKVNGVIPWAAVQTSKWVGGDPNPGTAFRVIESCGCYEVLPGYHYYKQISRAGQPGMVVASVSSTGGLTMAAFASNGTRHPDAFLLINRGGEPVEVRVAVKGTTARAFSAYRTSLSESYQPVGDLPLVDGTVSYTAPNQSVTTFFGH
jgi:hypothetical protein